MSRWLHHPSGGRTGALRSAGLLVLAGGLLSCAIPAGRPPRTEPIRVGWLSPTRPGEIYLEAFRDELQKLGYVEGTHLTLEYRFAEDQPERLPALAAELVSIPVHVILAVAPQSARAVKAVTGSVPTVTCCQLQPHVDGLVASLAQPGGNITGVSFHAPQSRGDKALELLHELAPSISHVAVLWNPDELGAEAYFQELRVAAEAMGVQLYSAGLRHPSELLPTLDRIVGSHVDALYVGGHPLFYTLQDPIVAFALAHRLPGVYPSRSFVAAGGLMTYAPSVPKMFRRTAGVVDKILKGKSPAEIPVEQPTDRDLVLNLHTAQTLGLTIPRELLLDATDVIQ